MGCSDELGMSSLFLDEDGRSPLWTVVVRAVSIRPCSCGRMYDNRFRAYLANNKENNPVATAYVGRCTNEPCRLVPIITPTTPFPSAFAERSRPSPSLATVIPAAPDVGVNDNHATAAPFSHSSFPHTHTHTLSAIQLHHLRPLRLHHVHVEASTSSRVRLHRHTHTSRAEQVVSKQRVFPLACTNRVNVLRYMYSNACGLLSHEPGTRFDDGPRPHHWKRGGDRSSEYQTSLFHRPLLAEVCSREGLFGLAGER